MSTRTKPRPMTFTVELPMTFTLESRPTKSRPLAVTLRTVRRNKQHPMTLTVDTVRSPKPCMTPKKAKRYAP